MAIVNCRQQCDDEKLILAEGRKGYKLATTLLHLASRLQFHPAHPTRARAYAESCEHDERGFRVAECVLFGSGFSVFALPTWLAPKQPKSESLEAKFEERIVIVIASHNHQGGMLTS